MERLDGPSLADELKARPGPRPWGDVLALGRAVAGALAAAHEQGVVHRAVHPGTVVLVTGRGAEGSAKLAGFGLARPEGAPAMTAAGAVLGTPAYVAPEVLGGAAATPAADVFGLGMLLYRLLAGRLPYDGVDDDSPVRSIAPAMRRAFSAGLPPVSRYAPVPEALDALLLACLSEAPAARPRDGAALAAALGALAEVPGPAPVRSASPLPGAPLRAGPAAPGPSAAAAVVRLPPESGRGAGPTPRVEADALQDDFPLVAPLAPASIRIPGGPPETVDALPVVAEFEVSLGAPSPERGPGATASWRSGREPSLPELVGPRRTISRPGGWSGVAESPAAASSSSSPEGPGPRRTISRLPGWPAVAESPAAASSSSSPEGPGPRRTISRPGGWPAVAESPATASSSNPSEGAEPRRNVSRPGGWPAGAESPTAASSSNLPDGLGPRRTVSRPGGWPAVVDSGHAEPSSSTPDALVPRHRSDDGLRVSGRGRGQGASGEGVLRVRRAGATQPSSTAASAIRQNPCGEVLGSTAPRRTLSRPDARPAPTASDSPGAPTRADPSRQDTPRPGRLLSRPGGRSDGAPRGSNPSPEPSAAGSRDEAPRRDERTAGTADAGATRVGRRAVSVPSDAELDSGRSSTASASSPGGRAVSGRFWLVAGLLAIVGAVVVYAVTRGEPEVVPAPPPAPVPAPPADRSAGTSPAPAGSQAPSPAAPAADVALPPGPGLLGPGLPVLPETVLLVAGFSGLDPVLTAVERTAAGAGLTLPGGRKELVEALRAELGTKGIGWLDPARPLVFAYVPSLDDDPVVLVPAVSAAAFEADLPEGAARGEAGNEYAWGTADERVFANRVGSVVVMSASAQAFARERAALAALAGFVPTAELDVRVAVRPWRAADPAGARGLKDGLLALPTQLAGPAEPGAAEQAERAELLDLLTRLFGRAAALVDEAAGAGFALDADDAGALSLRLTLRPEPGTALAAFAEKAAAMDLDALAAAPATSYLRIGGAVTPDFAAGAFEQALSTLATVLGLPAEDLAALRESAGDLTARSVGPGWLAVHSEAGFPGAITGSWGVADPAEYRRRADAFGQQLFARARSHLGGWDPLESTCRHASLSIL